AAGSARRPPRAPRSAPRSGSPPAPPPPAGAAHGARRRSRRRSRSVEEGRRWRRLGPARPRRSSVHTSSTLHYRPSDDIHVGPVLAVPAFGSPSMGWAWQIRGGRHEMTGTERRALRMILIVGLGAAALATTGCARRAYVATSYGGATYATAGGVTVYSAPPPAPVVVQRPAPVAGAVWVEGHYTWNGSQYVWVDGYYVQQRPGYTIVQPRWVVQGGRYVYVQGGWAQGGRVVHYVSPWRASRRRGVVERRPAYRPAPRRVGVQPRRGPYRPARGVRVHGPRGTVTVRPR